MSLLRGKMIPVRKELNLQYPLPTKPLLPHLQAILDAELGQDLGQADQKAQQVFVPTIGGKWKVKK